MASYRSRIPEIIVELENGLTEIVNRAGFRFELEAKVRARYDTGYMRRAIRWTPTGRMTGEVVGGASYTIFNEYGTVHMSAQPMFAPAAAIVEPIFQEEVELLLQKVIGGF